MWDWAGNLSCTWVQRRGFALQTPQKGRRDGGRKGGSQLYPAAAASSLRSSSMEPFSSSWAPAKQRGLKRISNTMGFNLITWERGEAQKVKGTWPQTPQTPGLPAPRPDHWMAQALGPWGLYSQGILWIALNTLQLQIKRGEDVS